MYDGGIRYFWNGIRHNHDLVIKKQIEKETFAVIKMDDRMITIAQSTTALLALGLVVFSLEVGKLAGVKGIKLLAKICNFCKTCGEIKSGKSAVVSNFIFVKPLRHEINTQ